MKFSFLVTSTLVTTSFDGTHFSEYELLTSTLATLESSFTNVKEVTLSSLEIHSTIVTEIITTISSTPVIVYSTFSIPTSTVTLYTTFSLASSSLVTVSRSSVVTSTIISSKMATNGFIGITIFRLD